MTLQIAGDPGVTVRVSCTLPGVPERVATVPGELTFEGASFDLRCTHGPQPGRLKLTVIRSAISLSTGDTTQPGQVTHFLIRQNALSVGVPEVPKGR